MRAELIDYMGDDLRVANAARVSFDKESEWEIDWNGTDEYLNVKDAKLIKYLASHNHFTPFTHCTITLCESVPIFVARQRFKHTVGFSYNEISRRYVDSPPEFYIPKSWRKRAENKKQGSSDEVVDLRKTGGYSYHYYDEPSDILYPIEFPSLEEAIRFKRQLEYDIYHWMNLEDVAPEQSRIELPLSTYTSYYVTGSLAAFARAYKLRSEESAQKEIQELAEHWDKIIRPLFPVSWEALIA